MDNPDGYKKAVDLWSLGCVMAVILVGYAPFDDPYKDLNPEMKNLEKDLKNLGISMRPRGFLSSLLIPDEQLRMDTKEALSHPWLAAPSQERRLEAIYQNMLLEWEPKDSNRSVVVDIDNIDGDDVRVASISSTPESEQTITPPACRLQSIDHVSETSLDGTIVQHNVQLQSPISLSSPANCNDPNPAPEQPKTQTNMKPPVAVPQATHKLIISPGQVATIEKISTEMPNPTGTPNLPAPPCQPQRSARTRLPIIRRARPSAGDIARPYETPATLKRWIYDIPRDENETEVYEEVCRPVTGKRKRLIYGQYEETVKKLLA
ncbi:hypothetical protein N7478_005581 [Penicillium angulare]|uniref:uncharacterized protein n=1 Tax=Penicillium angulare TaxID=116970 RepID=UPI00254108CD|nr:uncharacterized protein N7478_005581 [Penicillium angulare]KAJ5280209.1 hypothetical protein N7478_005581 [Penicillium angulare]